MATKLSIRSFFLMLFFLPLPLWADTVGYQPSRNCDTQRINANPLMKQALRAISQKSNQTVSLNSCYRSAERQQATCRRLCGRDSCANSTCAGRSQHTVGVAADFNLRGHTPQTGCPLLDAVRKEHLGGVRGGVGGYGGSAFHFDLDPQKKSWNNRGCAFLKNQPGYASGVRQNANADQSAEIIAEYRAYRNELARRPSTVAAVSPPAYGSGSPAVARSPLQGLMDVLRNFFSGRRSQDRGAETYRRNGQ